MKKEGEYTVIENTHELASFCKNSTYDFEKCIFKIELLFSGKTISSFRAKHCIFCEKVDFSNAVISGTYIMIFNAFFEKQLLLKNISFENDNSSFIIVSKVHIPVIPVHVFR